jgi:hypothetical protein
MSGSWYFIRVYNIIVKRLDTEDTGLGWVESISVFINYLHAGISETVLIGSSSRNEKVVSRSVQFDLRRSVTSVSIPKPYTLVKCPEYIFVSRVVFNRLFRSEIVHLPRNIFAVGIRYGLVYMYSESRDCLYMIDLTIKTLVSVALTKKLFREFYFLICANDGYMENHYASNIRNKPLTVAELEMVGVDSFLTTDEDTYPIFHKGLYVLGQSVQKVSPYVISVVDRYYLCMNKYNEYRSIHRGISFVDKKSAIVFASRPRGSKYNFINRRDISVSQREYFYSSAVEKTNIVCPEYIPREEMLHYKYILDIDGYTNSWEGTVWKLYSGSVVLKQKSIWEQWYYDELIEWVHYIPINNDFSNLEVIINWCIINDDICKQIAINAREFIKKKLNNEYVLTNIINKINNL